IVISCKCNKLYPYIKEPSEEKLEKSDYQDIKRNISSLFIYRIGVVLLNGTDNIIISKMLGLVLVGIYSNYLMIFNAINGILSQIFNSITASIGNLVVTNTEKKSENIFYILNFFNFWLYGMVGVCLIALINPFINLWIGPEYVLSDMTMFIIILNLYILGMQGVTSAYRNAYGLFKQGRFRPIAMIMINIISSIILAKYIGILGIVIGTLLSRLLTTAWFDPFIVYKYGFKSSPIKYYKKYVIYLFTFLVVSIGVKFVCDMFVINNIIILLTIAIIVIISTNLIFFALFGRTEEFKYLFNLAKEKINKIKNKKMSEKND
ncbi:MAG: lipopolysaccharide biosynthesis protein, partial [Clostridia bacterium]